MFIDGCFWHGCAEHYTPAKTNAAYWGPKIVANIARDLDTNERFETAGWTVLRFWEHTEPEEAASMIAAVVHAARLGS